MSVVVVCLTNVLHFVARHEDDRRVVVTRCGQRIALTNVCGKGLPAGPRLPCDQGCNR